MIFGNFPRRRYTFTVRWQWRQETLLFRIDDKFLHCFDVADIVEFDDVTFFCGIEKKKKN